MRIIYINGEAAQELTEAIQQKQIQAKPEPIEFPFFLFEIPTILKDLIDLKNMKKSV